LSDALTNISNDTVVTVSDNVVLPSSVTIDYLENITIIGQGNPTVNCKGTGALKFISCSNATIEGINWENCGSNNNFLTNAAIEFHDSSNISIKCCSLHNSTGQAILLSKVSRNVHIYNCTFIYNSQYGGHGAAVFYLPWEDDQDINKLIIQASNFTMNGAAISLIYISN